MSSTSSSDGISRGRLMDSCRAATTSSGSTSASSPESPLAADKGRKGVQKTSWHIWAAETGSRTVLSLSVEQLLWSSTQSGFSFLLSLTGAPTRGGLPSVPSPSKFDPLCLPSGGYSPFHIPGLLFSGCCPEALPSSSSLQKSGSLWPQRM